MENNIKELILFLCKKTFIQPDPDIFDEEIINMSLLETIADVRYHYPDRAETDIIDRINYNHNELLIFLYRLGSRIWRENNESKSLKVIHWLMRELGAAEIYYSNQIDVGFYIMHGIGTMIGANNKIGKGFMVYPHCGIMRDCIIGNNVTIYWGCLLKENISVGNNVKIGANTIILKDIPDNAIVYGNPNTIK